MTDFSVLVYIQNTVFSLQYNSEVSMFLVSTESATWRKRFFIAVIAGSVVVLLLLVVAVVQTYRISRNLVLLAMKRIFWRFGRLLKVRRQDVDDFATTSASCAELAHRVNFIITVIKEDFSKYLDLFPCQALRLFA